MNAPCKVRWSGIRDYLEVVNEMVDFTNNRSDNTLDEIWLLQHNPVYTQGTSCTQTPHTNPTDIPLVKSSRGGQISYHGPGQLIIYAMLDIKRLGLGPRSLVNRIEQSVIRLLDRYGLEGMRMQDAPGVYVGSAKIAALGLRIRNGRCFHGLSLNVDMDLRPFQWIDPCGQPGMAVTQLADLGVKASLRQVGDDLVKELLDEFHWD